MIKTDNIFTQKITKISVCSFLCGIKKSAVFTADFLLFKVFNTTSEYHLVFVADDILSNIVADTLTVCHFA